MSLLTELFLVLMTRAINISLLTEFDGIQNLLSLPHVLKLTPERHAGEKSRCLIICVTQKSGRDSFGERTHNDEQRLQTRVSSDNPDSLAWFYAGLEKPKGLKMVICPVDGS